MTLPSSDCNSKLLRTALEHAQRLTDLRPEGSTYSAVWSAQATQVGDISVLALAALRD